MSKFFEDTVYQSPVETKPKKSTKKAPAPSITKYRVKTPLYLREKPSKDSTTLKVLQAGEIVEVIEDLGVWVKTAEGYHMKEFLELV